ncbi:hypothetical protein BpHYR1_009791 [Brachionus plicatilis]|uniref:Uncharacterized protein n=1 Tax=Brachionus plicatilis TaxID=10195 RepID=A0A3M7P191_BRAPC|nr:hypothetical protein BpHYR1_009791 [Brachionus plicatilis]
MKFTSIFAFAMCFVLALAGHDYGKYGNERPQYGHAKKDYKYNPYERVYVQNSNKNANENREKMDLENESENVDINLNTLWNLILKLKEDKYENGYY